MSQLSDRMRRAARTEARPVGLVAAAKTAQATMLVVADVSAADAAGVTAAAADALLFAEDSAESALTIAAKLGVPIGVRLTSGDRARVAALRAAGADFIVLSEECAASATMDQEMSFILELAAEPSDTDLRALNALPLEGLLAGAVDGLLTIRRSLGLRRITTFVQRPLMLPVSDETSVADLEALRELNVLLLLAPLASAAALKERVLTLPPRRRRREESAVGVPTTLFSRAAMAPPDEDGDHEHE